MMSVGATLFAVMGASSVVVVPAVCAVMLADRWMTRLAVGWGVAATASLVGLWASYRLDLPTGAAIVCTCGVLLALVSVVVAFRRSEHRVVEQEPGRVNEPAIGD